MTIRTSETHPLLIPWVETPAGGRIGMTLCPGKVDPTAITGRWERDLQLDMEAVRAWGADALVSLVEEGELEFLQVPGLGEQAQILGIRWYHLPIRDRWIPDGRFDAAWLEAGAELRRILDNGGGVVLHCRGGLGRTGTIAARLLIERGEAPDRALERVRRARPGAVETFEQENYVLYGVPNPCERVPYNGDNDARMAG